MRIGVVGASGRSGSLVVQVLLNHPQHTLGAAIVSPESKLLGKIASSRDNQMYVSGMENLRGCDGVIDFSLPLVSMQAVKWCAYERIPIVVATTGHSEEERTEIAEFAQSFPCALVSNTSVGATALGAAASLVQQLLGDRFDIEVSEIHHRMKKDAPSGTAATLVDILAQDTGKRVFGRSGMRHEGEIGIVSLRGGDIPGDHTVYFLGMGERIELTHRVHDRRIFAQGAVTFLERLACRGPGLYSARDLLTLTAG